jgi:3-hydroxybutyryl-CoA dehydrogenase
VESVVEDMEAKVRVLRGAAQRCPRAILASNTSSLSISTLGAASGAAARTIGTHYWNPPLLMTLVEVIRGQATDAAVVERQAATLRGLGKRPIVVEKDVPGFVWNRMQLALLREAVWLVEQGVASPAAVDEVVRDGLARRWRLTGPFQTVALGGAETFERIAANLLPVLSKSEALPGLERWLRDSQSTLDAARERRDDGLAADLGSEREGEEETGQKAGP